MIPKDSLLSIAQYWDYRHMPPQMSFFMASWDTVLFLLLARQATYQLGYLPLPPLQLPRSCIWILKQVYGNFYYSPILVKEILRLPGLLHTTSQVYYLLNVDAYTRGSLTANTTFYSSHNNKQNEKPYQLKKLVFYERWHNCQRIYWPDEGKVEPGCLGENYPL